MDLDGKKLNKQTNSQRNKQRTKGRKEASKERTNKRGKEESRKDGWFHLREENNTYFVVDKELDSVVQSEDSQGGHRMLC